MQFQARKEKSPMNFTRFSGRRGFRLSAAGMACITIGFFLALGLFLPGDLHGKESGVKMIPADFIRLAEKARPAVVNIRTEKTVEGGGGMFRHFQRGPGDPDDPFREFFDRFFGEGPQRQFKQRSLGSGFIIDKNGYVVTNNHVIEAADDIKVKLTNDKEYDAVVVGKDPNTDLALIRLEDAKDLPALPLGDSDAIRVGEWVIAVGSPFGLEHTVTAGIISAKGRVIGSGPYDDYLQTDASINPGNSGGPLINMKGEVVGINTAIVAAGQGIGFAIPVNLARSIVKQLRESGEVTRGWLGVAIQDLTEELAEYYGLEEKKGVMVAQVFEGDPAEKAGIRARDIIIEIGGEAVASSRELTSRIASIPPGKKTAITVLRDGMTKTFKVKIAKRDDERIAAGAQEAEPLDDLGIRVSELTPEAAERFQLSDTEGVLVVDVDPEGRASKAGLMPGDVIKEINHRAIRSVADYNAAIGAAGDEIQLFVRRERTGFLVIKIKTSK
jgi:serine protease Do